MQNQEWCPGLQNHSPPAPQMSLSPVCGALEKSMTLQRGRLEFDTQSRAWSSTSLNPRFLI